MTAVALFFIAAAWVLTRRVSGVLLAVILVTLIKMYDAVLLSLPLRNGAVANPIFAFWTEALVLLVVVALAKGAFTRKTAGQAAAGGLAALGAAGIFPLAGYITGIPACVFPGTSYPLSVYYAPIAVVLSLLTVPLGFWAGLKISAAEARHEAFTQSRAFRYLVSPAALILCLLLVASIRLAG
jgi:hypothetical protein